MEARHAISGRQLELDLDAQGVTPLPKPCSWPWKGPSAEDAAKVPARTDATEGKGRRDALIALDAGRVARREESAGSWTPKPAKRVSKPRVRPRW